MINPFDLTSQVEGHILLPHHDDVLAFVVIAAVFLLAGLALVCWLAENKTFNRWSRKATKGLRR